MKKLKYFLVLIWLSILVTSLFPAILVQGQRIQKVDNAKNSPEADTKGRGVTNNVLFESSSTNDIACLNACSSYEDVYPLLRMCSTSLEIEETNHTESCVGEPMNTPETAIVSGTIFAETCAVSDSGILATYSRHLMCKDRTGGNPIDPTTTFLPSDAKAGLLMTVTVSSEVVSEWYYRNDDLDEVWDYYGGATSSISGTWHVFHYTPISGNPDLPAYPRGWKIEVYLDGSHSFDEYFEITNDGRQSVTCEDVVSWEPVNIKSTFTIGVDPQVYYYLRLYDVAYYNENTDHCHDYLVKWYKPDGTLYLTWGPGGWSDYKNPPDGNPAYDYWGWAAVKGKMTLDSNTQTGQWKIETYIDQYYDGGWKWYQIVTTYFNVQSVDKPDLVVEDIWWDPDSPTAGEPFDIYFRIKNQGQADAIGTFRNKLYIDGNFYAYGDNDGLAKGATFVWKTLGVTLDAGLHTFKAVTDADDNIDESNEGNNERSETCNIPPGQAKWSMLVYLDGDNNLEPYWIDDFLDMAKVGSDGSINIVVQFDRGAGWWEGGEFKDDTRYGDWQDCKRFLVTAGMTPDPSNALESIGEVNMGDDNVLINFGTWAIGNFPADRYLLVIQDHGGSWVGCCWDDTSGGDHLDSSEIKSALSSIKLTLGRNIDVVWFDDCLMCSVEIATQVYPYADYMAGSETIGWTGNWPYDSILNSLETNPTMSSQDLAIEITELGTPFDSSTYRTQSISSIDLSKVSALVSTVDSFVTSLKNNLNLYRTEITNARSATGWFVGPYGGDEDCIVDLYHFAQNVKSYVPDSTIQSLAQNIMDKIGPAGGSVGYVVMKEKHTTTVSFCHGLSIYFPSIKENYRSSYTVGTDFTASTQWDEFLDEYYTPALKPDLVVAVDDTTLPDLTPAEPVAGQPIWIWFTLDNIGESDAIETFTNKFYIDSNYVGSQTQTGLDTTTVVLIHLETTQGAGYHEVEAVADANNNVDESNEDNNEDTKTFWWKSPDLTVEDIWTDPPNPYEGQPFTVYFRIRNQGDADANQIFYTRARLCIDDTEVWSDEYPLNGLVAGLSHTFSAEHSGVTAGTYYLHVITDANNDIDEANKDTGSGRGTGESNNEGEETFDVNPTYSVTINAHCNSKGVDVSVPFTWDGSPYSTPETFTDQTGDHEVVIDERDAEGHLFVKWLKDGTDYSTDRTITVSSGGIYTAIYQAITIHDFTTCDEDGNTKTTFQRTETVYVCFTATYPDGSSVTTGSASVKIQLSTTDGVTWTNKTALTATYDVSKGKWFTEIGYKILKNETYITAVSLVRWRAFFVANTLNDGSGNRGPYPSVTFAFYVYTADLNVVITDGMISGRTYQRTLTTATVRLNITYPDESYFTASDLGQVIVTITDGVNTYTLALSATNYDEVTKKWAISWTIPKDATLSIGYKFKIAAHDVLDSVAPNPNSGPTTDISDVNTFSVVKADLTVTIVNQPAASYSRGQNASFDIRVQYPDLSNLIVADIETNGYIEAKVYYNETFITTIRIDSTNASTYWNASFSGFTICWRIPDDAPLTTPTVKYNFTIQQDGIQDTVTPPNTGPATAISSNPFDVNGEPQCTISVKDQPYASYVWVNITVQSYQEYINASIQVQFLWNDTQVGYFSIIENITEGENTFNLTWDSLDCSCPIHVIGENINVTVTLKNYEGQTLCTAEASFTFTQPDKELLWDRLTELIQAWPTVSPEYIDELWVKIVKIVMLYPNAP